MNLLFIQGGSRLKESENGNLYVDGNFSADVWERYLSICDNLTVILRKEKELYDESFAEQNFNKMPVLKKMHIVPVDDIVSTPFKFYDVKASIYDEISKVDKVIIRSCSLFTIIAYEACLKFGKPYLFEVTAFIRESLKYHSLLGKLVSSFFERMCVRIAEKAQCAIYVTNDALQKRYPCLSGKMLGCSDVQLQQIDNSVLAKRLAHINRNNGKIIKIGTAAFLDVKWKGQSLVIKALAVLKAKGINNISYELVGIGNGKSLIELADKLGVREQVHILGAKTHEDVFNWMDSIDLYVQPSFQEGLCRAIVEAMSRACPVICSDAGGNYELVDRDYIFPCGDYLKLADLIKRNIINFPLMAKNNFLHVQDYEKTKLDNKRTMFFGEFIKN